MAPEKLNTAQAQRILTVSEQVKALVADAPPLTVEQCAIIRAQLGSLPQPAHQAVAA